MNKALLLRAARALEQVAHTDAVHMQGDGALDKTQLPEWADAQALRAMVAAPPKSLMSRVHEVFRNENLADAMTTCLSILVHCSTVMETQEQRKSLLAALDVVKDEVEKG